MHPKKTAHPQEDSSWRAALLKKKQLAAALNLSPRTIDNLQAQKKIPVIILSPRCCRYSLEAVMRSLNRFQVEAVK
jgi:hypothetical protein